MSYLDYLYRQRNACYPDHADHDIVGWPTQRAVKRIECHGGEWHHLEFPEPLMSKDDWERDQLAQKIALYLSEHLRGRVR